MAAATIEKRIETAQPSLDVARLEAVDAETYQTIRFRYIEGAIVGLNHDTDTTVNAEDDDSSAINGAQDGVIINSPTISNKTMSLLLIGRK